MNWRNNLRDVEPYVAGEQPKMSHLIKLNTNENPYEPGEKVKEAIQTFDPFKLRLYPDADASKLKHLIAEYHGLDDKQVFIGNGSDEVLALTFLTCFNGKDHFYSQILRILSILFTVNYLILTIKQCR